VCGRDFQFENHFGPQAERHNALAVSIQWNHGWTRMKTRPIGFFSKNRAASLIG
jgi:hypothetical protein